MGKKTYFQWGKKRGPILELLRTFGRYFHYNITHFAAKVRLFIYHNMGGLLYNPMYSKIPYFFI